MARIQKNFDFQTDEDRKYITDVVNRIGDLYKHDITISGDALIILAKAFEEGIETIELREIPSSVEDTLKQIFCDFIRYETVKIGKEDITGYFCYENFDRKKKGTLIGKNDNEILQRCNVFCEKSKKLALEKTIQKELRKTNLKKLLDLRDIMINLTRDLSLAQIYICKANLLEEHQILLSIDGLHLACPLEKDDSVSVIEHCYNQVDPTTMNPPCRYLIDPYIKVKMEPDEDAQEIIRELTQIEHQPEATIKDVDAEVIESEEDKENE